MRHAKLLKEKIMAEKTEFKAGDVVQLASKGPQMTILSITQPDARCGWFDGNKAREKHFPIAALKKVKPEEGAPQ